MCGNFCEMLDTVIGINFRGSNFVAPAFTLIIAADDVIRKLVHMCDGAWPKYSFNDIALHCIA